MPTAFQIRPTVQRLRERATLAQFLGEPTFFPLATEVVWTLAEDRSIYVVEHADGAGRCVVTVFVDDRDARSPGSLPATYSGGARKVVYRDSDGNEVGFGGLPRPG